MPELHFHPAIARHAFGRSIAGHRLRLAHAANADGGSGQVQLFAQICRHGQGARFGQTGVVPENPPRVGGQALVVGMADHREAQAALALIARHQGVHLLIGGGQQVGLARSEQGAHPVVADQFAGLRRALRLGGGAHGLHVTAANARRQRVSEIRLPLAGRSNRLVQHAGVIHPLARRLGGLLRGLIGHRRQAGHPQQSQQRRCHRRFKRKFLLIIHAFHHLPSPTGLKISVSTIKGGISGTSSSAPSAGFCFD